MSQEQPRRSEGDTQEPIKYGDVFNVSGDLAQKPVAPEDAAMMQTAETMMFGQTQKGGTAATMQAAATRNERSGQVGHRDATDIARDQGVTVTETFAGGQRIVTESVAGQVVGQYVQPVPTPQGGTGAAGGGSQRAGAGDAITIGEALEASALTAGDKPLDQSDAAAIQAAEVRATGSNIMAPGGLGATAQSAAAYNAAAQRDEEKVKLADVVSDATARLPADKVATRQDAEGVVSAEMRNDPNVTATPGGIAASVAAAARLNERGGV